MYPCGANIRLEFSNNRRDNGDDASSRSVWYILEYREKSRVTCYGEIAVLYIITSLILSLVASDEADNSSRTPTLGSKAFRWWIKSGKPFPFWNARIWNRDTRSERHNFFFRDSVTSSLRSGIAQLPLRPLLKFAENCALSRSFTCDAFRKRKRTRVAIVHPRSSGFGKLFGIETACRELLNYGKLSRPGVLQEI